MSEESREQLLRRLAASDRPVTARQLERWCKAGKVARPVRRHLPGVRGSVSRFPSDAFGQAAAMFDASRQGSPGVAGDRRLRVRGFLLWWDGKPIAADPRQLILKAAAPVSAAVDRIRNEERTIVADETSAEYASDDTAFDTAEAYVAKHSTSEPLRGPALRRIFRNLGWRSDDLVSVIVALLTTVLGGHPAVDGPALENEPSLASLILKAFAADQFPQVPQTTGSPTPVAPIESSTDEQQLRDILESAAFLSDPDRVQAFLRDLSDDELIAARKYARVLLEDVPLAFEAFEIIFGKNKFAATVQTLTRVRAEIVSHLVIAVAWLVRKFGTARFEMITESFARVRPQAQALCALAKAFPNYRELFLARNIQRLAALPEETRSKMVDSIKTLIPQ